MDDLISKQLAIEVADAVWVVTGDKNVAKVWDQLKDLPTADTIEVVRCKDCKHRPIGEDRDDLEFPDDKCPCKCEDYWYSWKPSDNWFCGNGERKDSNYDER